MKYAAFICKACGDELTDFLHRLDEAELKFERRESAVPAGGYFEITQPWTYQDFITDGGLRGHYISSDGDLIVIEPGDFLLNVADVQHRIAEGAVHGCCGWQPRNEPNATCANGHHVGTLHSDDCWSAIVFRVIGNKVDKLLL